MEREGTKTEFFRKMREHESLSLQTKKREMECKDQSVVMKFPNLDKHFKKI